MNGDESPGVRARRRDTRTASSVASSVVLQWMLSASPERAWEPGLPRDLTRSTGAACAMLRPVAVSVTPVGGALGGGEPRSVGYHTCLRRTAAVSKLEARCDLPLRFLAVS